MKLYVCDNCKANENSKPIKIFKLNNRGYGSQFDSLDIEIDLCDDCIKKLGIKEEWFDNDLNQVYETIQDEHDPIVEHLYVFDYTNEDKVVDAIKKLPIRAQEKILNRPSSCNPFVMDSEEWIEIYRDGFFF